ncbi:hypothetical protein ACFW2V_13670 [Streptomyces sp. NPDC058947]|uniref:hypothetical protein n=1 Tax=Streptomyces sp. NPDC058947 TaxID=3346675 RepID=UPI0036B1C261
MKTYIIQVGADDPREMESPEEVHLHLAALLCEQGWSEGTADSTARTTALRLGKGGQFAPDNKVTDVRPDGAWVRAWWEERV